MLLAPRLAMDELAKVESLNKLLAQILGGDNCHSIDHIMRLPGHTNLPNAAKRARGRVPGVAQIIALNAELRYKLEDFSGLGGLVQTSAPPLTAGAGSTDALLSSVDEFTRDLILTGDDLNRPRGDKNARYKSRSEAVFRVSCDLVRAGCVDELISATLLNPSYGISASILEKRRPEDYVARQIMSAREKCGDTWPDGINSKGKPARTYANTLIAIQRLELSTTYDSFHKRKYVGGLALQAYQGEFSDNTAVHLRRIILREFGFDAGKDHVHEALHALCLEHQFHPVMTYLDNLNWDGIERLPTFLIRYMGAEDTPLNRAIGKILLVAAVRRIRQPGTKFDFIVVLEGPQGSGKSSVISILAGRENFSDQNILALDPKAQMEAIEGVWIYELSELEGLSKAETGKIKAFASRSEDRNRPAYARLRESHPRETIFVGTTNDDHYLTDQTGNRRFWPVRTGKIDLEMLARDRDLLWAEAAAIEAGGASILLPRDLWIAAARQQEERMVDDGWFDMLAAVVGERAGLKRRVTSSYLLSHIIGIPKERQTPAAAKRVMGIMRRLGWDGPKLLRIGGGAPVRGYERSDGQKELNLSPKM